MLGVIVRVTQNRIQDPAKLRWLIVDLMDQEDWMMLRDEDFEDADNLPGPAVIAAGIAEDLEAALGQFAEIAASLSRQPEDD